ncbi:MAG: hypothetical protein ACLR43_14765 [Faecalibacillus faecis]
MSAQFVVAWVASMASILLSAGSKGKDVH